MYIYLVNINDMILHDVIEYTKIIRKDITRIRNGVILLCTLNMNSVT